MLTNHHIALVCLHSSGCTHLDMKKLFLEGEIPHPEVVWENLLLWNFALEIPEERRKKILEKAGQVDIQKIKNTLESKSIEIIDWTHSLYPERLKTIWHAPFFLYVRGILRSDIPLIGVVGSRKHTPYAKKILEKILPDIIQVGVWVISGGATWVDTIWHDITLTHSGYTIVVFGTGIDRCYPAQNKSLFERIITSGGVAISHFPLGTGPELYNFPIRNELVAGLSHGILIPEAGLSSGTLITAQLALEHGRDVFAVPGDIDRSTSEWTNMLIASSQAKCVRCAGDILEEYFDIGSIAPGMTPVVRVAPIFENEREKTIYDAVENSVNRVDDLSQYTWLEMTDILTTLAMLEINGFITIDEMGRYRIA